MRSRKSKEIIPHAVVNPVPLHGKPLLTALAVVRQGAIRKAITLDRAGLLDHADNPAGVERPKPTMMNQDCDCGSNFNVSFWTAKLHPSQMKHLPTSYGLDCLLE